MAEVRVASGVGFCFGVERAVRMAKEAAERAKGKVYSYGQLVHNRLVVEHLRGLGI
ncbi:MAG TPA: 4-hydroxy-3-methylbut-2-enyl diphosphate reductase, partial [Armatimonadetes bacterium]|nr:4-hydroxy-3-methylbut-2-enyl diphosphate reductase [Armatimonadota bacterium]